MTYDGRCEAWCWTHSTRRDINDNPVRRCSKGGFYDGLTLAVLCSQHVDNPNTCFTEQEAVTRRYVSKKRVAA